MGGQRLTLDEIIVRLNVIVGDMSRASRDSQEKHKPTNERELKKEMGNIIFSMIRWCDDLDYDPKDCVALARQAQIRYNTD